MIDCFCSENLDTPSPAYLEAEILEVFLKEKRGLPPANNEF
jgi:hypothetical protein